MELMGRDLSAGMTGDDVGLLQYELSAVGLPIALSERESSTFGDTTRAAVQQFQHQHGLRITGVCDAVLGRMLGEAFGTITPVQYIVKGRLSTSDGKPFSAGRVRAFDMARDGVTLRFLGEDQPDAEGRYFIAYPKMFVQVMGKEFADLVAMVIGRDGKELVRTGPIPHAPAETTVDLTIPVATTATARTVAGKIYDERGVPVAGLDVLVYHIGFQCSGVALGHGVTGADGGYLVGYQHEGVANLQIRALDQAGAEVALCQPKYRAANNEIINLVCPASVRPAAAEFERMMADLDPFVGRAGLGEAQENDECRDITLLARTTAWDARLIALAAGADKLSGATGVSIPALYALLRVGLPADAQQLARLRPEAIAKAFAKATAAGVVNLSQDEVRAAVAELESHARQTLLSSPAAPGTLSTMGELLETSGLEQSHQDAFAQIVATHDGSSEELWEAARAHGIPDAGVAKLQTQGKLAQLTLNNATLISALRADAERQPLSALLMRKDLYKKEAWQEYLGRLGTSDELIPPAYSGANAEERLAVYAEDLARKVRIGLPTHVVARRVETGDLVVPRQADVARVLYQAADDPDLNFRFGTTPTRTFLKDNPQLLSGVEDPQAVADIMVMLHRVYQITPSDEAMKVLLDEGLTSAHLVTSYDHDGFVKRYGSSFDSASVASLIYRKSELVSAVAYNAFAAAQQVGTAPVVYAMSPSSEVAQAAKDNLIKHFPTMEGLFGELDFCECDHCRSVLSPAAYLVDMLRFLDPEDAVWEATRATPSEPKPFAVLDQRRPDLEHLPLTCENTHTVLPYIDIVNEILEWAVAKPTDELPARDVGLAESSDLLAEPQNVLGDAYPLLRDAAYPLGLPYDLWLDTVRKFSEKLDAPLPSILDQLCSASDLDTSTAPYGWREVFREQLGLSPQEYDHFTAGTAGWEKLYGYTDPGVAHNELRQAKTLARRLGVSYKELVELVKTWFVNPELDTLGLIRKLGLDTTDVMRYLEVDAVTPFDQLERQAFETRIAELEQVHGLTPGSLLQELDTAYNNAVFDEILVLADSDPGCSFEHTRLRFFVEPVNSDYAGYLLKINLMVRLRRRLGWKLSEVDAALRAFHTETGGMRTALLHLAHLKKLTEKVRLGRDARTALLSLWSDMDPSRYAKLFLNPRMRSADRAAFDHPFGRYLSTPGVLLSAHLSAVQGALNLEVDDIKLILGSGYEAALLSMATLSLLDRHKLLAKALKLSVADVLALKQLSGVDPFRPVADHPVVATLDHDAPYQTLRFVELAMTVKAAGLRVADLDYLIRNIFDPAGTLHSRPERVVELVRHVATEIRRIRAEHAMPVDGLDFTDEVITQKLSLVLPADVATTLIGMWAETITYYADEPAAVADQLDPATFRAEPRLSVSYDSVREQQRLSHRGVLMPAEAARLKTTYPGALFASLIDQIEDGDVQPDGSQARRYLEQYLAKPVGFLDLTDFDVLFGPFVAGPTPPPVELQAEDWQRARRLSLAQRFLPFLQDRLIRTMIAETLAGEFDAEPGVLEVLAQPLAGALAGAGTAGLTVTYVDSGGTVLGTALSSDGGIEPGPAGTTAVRLEGYIEVPVPGPYRFVIDTGVPAELRLHHLVEPLAPGADGRFPVTELAAGTLYRVSLTAPNGNLRLDVLGTNLPRGHIGRLTCYPQATIDETTQSYVAVHKATRLAAELRLTESEARHYSSLNLLAPTWTAVLRLCRYTLLRDELQAGEGLIDIFRYAARTPTPDLTALSILDDARDRIAKLTRRTTDTVKSATETLGFVTAAPLSDEEGMGKLWRMLALAKQLGVAPAVVGLWADPAPTEASAAALRATLKARYDIDGWRRMVRPISDALRQARRDALVAYLMDKRGYTSVEQLFEHFLVDPGTEPVVQTSRLRLAISSVQTFIQRCLMNLEPQVRPQAINSTQWAWMKRYRVWEANRKIFLWPENWLEPEFRDDKSHLFQALEGELLQGDVSQDLAEDAFLHYLSGLDKIAKLQIVSTWLQEHDNDPAHNTLHVVGRTYHKPGEYFYRRYQHHAWTPWEPINGSIEGDHVVVTLWRNRPYLYWLTFVERQEADTKTADINDVIRYVDVQLNWAEYLNGQWSAAEATDLNRPLTAKVDKGFDRRNIFMHASTYVDDDRDEVMLHLSLGGAKHQPATTGNIVWIYQPVSLPQASSSSNFVVSDIDFYVDHKLVDASQSLYRRFHLVGRNAPVEIGGYGDDPVSPPFTWDGVRGTRYVGSGPLTVWHTSRIDQFQGKTTEDKAPKQVLDKGGQFEIVIPPNAVHTTAHAEIDSLVRPFFYQDYDHTLYAEPTVTERIFHEWDGWVVTVPPPKLKFDLDTYWEEIYIDPVGPVVNPPDAINPIAIYTLQTPDQSMDAVAGSSMAVQFGGSLIGPGGSFHNGGSKITGGAANG